MRQAEGATPVLISASLHRMKGCELEPQGLEMSDCAAANPVSADIRIASASVPRQRSLREICGLGNCTKRFGAAYVAILFSACLLFADFGRLRSSNVIASECVCRTLCLRWGIPVCRRLVRAGAKRLPGAGMFACACIRRG